MKKIISILVAMIIASLVYAQEQSSIINDSPEKFPVFGMISTKIGGAPFEMISTHDTAVSYRINKETGDVWYISVDKFIDIPRDKSEIDTIIVGQTNYQLFINERKMVYLMNINTGAVWYKTDKMFSNKDCFILLKEMK